VLALGRLAIATSPRRVGGPLPRMERSDRRGEAEAASRLAPRWRPRCQVVIRMTDFRRKAQLSLAGAGDWVAVGRARTRASCCVSVLLITADRLAALRPLSQFLASLHPHLGVELLATASTIRCRAIYRQRRAPVGRPQTRRARNRNPRGQPASCYRRQQPAHAPSSCALALTTVGSEHAELGPCRADDRLVPTQHLHGDQPGWLPV